MSPSLRASRIASLVPPFFSQFKRNIAIFKRFGLKSCSISIMCWSRLNNVLSVRSKVNPVSNLIFPKKSGAFEKRESHSYRVSISNLNLGDCPDVKGIKNYVSFFRQRRRSQ